MLGDLLLIHTKPEQQFYAHAHTNPVQSRYLCNSLPGQKETRAWVPPLPRPPRSSDPPSFSSPVSHQSLSPQDNPATGEGATTDPVLLLPSKDARLFSRVCALFPENLPPLFTSRPGACQPLIFPAVEPLEASKREGLLQLLSAAILLRLHVLDICTLVYPDPFYLPGMFALGRR